MLLGAWVVVVALICVASAAVAVLAWPERARRGAAVTALVLAVLGAAVALVVVLQRSGPSDGQLRAGMGVALATSLAIVGAWRVGDRARGRRRCPGCWYSMDGAAGLLCPECGRTAGSERDVLRTRRSTRVLAAAAAPVGLVLAIWVLALAMDPRWPSRLPNAVLALAAPVAEPDTRIAGEIKDSMRMSFSPRHVREYSGWERWMLARAGRRFQADTGRPDRVFYGVLILFNLGADDRGTAQALAALVRSPDRSVSEPAAIMCGNLRTAWAPVREALGEFIARAAAGGDADLCEVGVLGLLGMQRRDPGGPVPRGVVEVIERGPLAGRGLGWRLLGLFDQDADARRVLLAGAASGREGAADAVVSLAALWPEDADVQRLVLEALRADPGASSARYDTMTGLVEVERRWLERDGRLPSQRAALYTPEICAELEPEVATLEHAEQAFKVPGIESSGPSRPEVLRRVLEQARGAHAAR